MADDGSGPSTAALVESWQAGAGDRVVHVWHEDKGFRAAEIRNRAILAARGTYCVFLDGDCVVRPGFVAAHRRLAEPGWFVSGKRVLLSRELTERVLREGLTPGQWPFASVCVCRTRYIRDASGGEHGMPDGCIVWADRSAFVGSVAGGRIGRAVGGGERHSASRQCPARAARVSVYAVPVGGLRTESHEQECMSRGTLTRTGH